ncbi:MAG TPA: hypothetical protein VGO34_14890 [Alphaproteobacteria bacterium]|jgi:integrin beta 3
MPDAQKMADDLFDAVKAYLDASVEAIVRRLESVEAREPARGEKGETGAAGNDGLAGAQGERGGDGPQGVAGPQGEAGHAGAAGVAGEAGPQGEKGLPGADGIGLAGAFIDRDGGLVLMMTNGQSKVLGPVIGKDGQAGKDGADGCDGFGFDDLEMLHDGERGFTMRFTRGEQVKEFAFSIPVVLDRGVFKEGEAYRQGDGVTMGGSFWIARTDTTARPGDGETWRLAVKKGRDAKEPVKIGTRANG